MRQLLNVISAKRNNVSNQQTAAIERTMEGIGRVHRFFMRDALKRLPDVLQSNELPICIANASQGPNVGCLVATDRRVFFCGKDGLGRIRNVDITYDRISSVTVDAKLTKHVVINAGGHDEVFSSVSKADEVSTVIREKVSAARHVATMSNEPAPSTADELAKMAGLHRQGVLTDDEFAEVKSKLLAR